MFPAILSMSFNYLDSWCIKRWRRRAWESFFLGGTYSGRNEGWRFSPPYLAPRRMRGGTKRPKDTAITRLMEGGGYRMVRIREGSRGEGGLGVPRSRQRYLARGWGGPTSTRGVSWGLRVYLAHIKLRRGFPADLTPPLSTQCIIVQIPS